MEEGDYYRLSRREQMKGLPNNMIMPLKKYIAAQRLYCDWLPYELAPEVVVKPPHKLYEELRGIGFIWDRKKGVWRLDGRRKKPVSYFAAFEDGRL